MFRQVNDSTLVGAWSWGLGNYDPAALDIDKVVTNVTGPRKIQQPVRDNAPT